jgi:ATP-dependent protease ClpP protease subunit
MNKMPYVTARISASNVKSEPPRLDQGGSSSKKESKTTPINVFIIFFLLFGNIESAHSTVANFSDASYPWWDIKGQISQKDFKDIQALAGAHALALRRLAEFEAESEKFLQSKSLTRLSPDNEVVLMIPLEKGGCNCAKNMRLIRASSESRMSAAVARYNLKHPVFRLNSGGGDLDAAIGIGRLVRRMSAQVIVPAGGKCYSACVFIAAGGVHRSLNDRTGIHRPYSTRTDYRDFATVQAEFNRTAAIAKAYLQEMNVSPALYDAMVSIPPEKLRILSESELDEFGLGPTDPVQQEIDDAAFAQDYKLSKSEFLRRKAKAKTACPPATSSELYEDCWDKMMKAPKNSGG